MRGVFNIRGAFKASAHLALDVPGFRKLLRCLHEDAEIASAALLVIGAKQRNVIRVQGVEGKVRVIERKLPDLPVLEGVEERPRLISELLPKGVQYPGLALELPGSRDRGIVDFPQ